MKDPFSLHYSDVNTRNKFNNGGNNEHGWTDADRI